MLLANVSLDRLILFLFQLSFAPFVNVVIVKPITGRGALDVFSEFSYAPRSGFGPLELPNMSFVGAVISSSDHFATPIPIIGLASSRL